MLVILNCFKLIKQHPFQTFSQNWTEDYRKKKDFSKKKDEKWFNTFQSDPFWIQSNGNMVSIFSKSNGLVLGLGYIVSIKSSGFGLSTLIPIWSIATNCCSENSIFKQYIKIKGLAIHLSLNFG